MGQEKLSIYSYGSAAAYLRDSWSRKKQLNSSFSMRAWAKKLGFRNNAPLSLMLQSKRPIPKKYIPLFARSLGLSDKEADFLELLVELNREKSKERKELILKKMKSKSGGRRVAAKEVESFHFLESPLATSILEMIALKDFQWNFKWIQECLYHKYTLREISEVIQNLKSLDLVSISKDRVLKTHANVQSSQDINNMAVQNYHEKSCGLAAEAVRVQDVNQKEFNSFSFNIKKSKIPTAKRLLREFLDVFLNEVEATEGSGEETYQLNLQLFAITNNSDSRGKTK